MTEIPIRIESGEGLLSFLELSFTMNLPDTIQLGDLEEITLPNVESNKSVITILLKVKSDKLATT